MNQVSEAPIPDEAPIEEAAKEDLTEKWNDFLTDEVEEEDDAVIDELETPAPESETPAVDEAGSEEEVVEAKTEPEPEPAPVEEAVVEPELEKPEAVEQPVEEVVEAPPVEEPAPIQRTAEEVEALRSRAQEELRKGYELSTDEAENMLSEPEKVLPALAAKVHMQVYEQVVQGVIAQLPNMVKGIIKQDQEVRSNEESFYDRWPQLKDHGAQVGQVAALWRQLNPQATTKEAVENIGKHTMIALGYPVGGQEVAQATPQVETPNAPPAPAPLGSATPPAPPKPQGQFEQLADEFLIDEED